MVAHGLARASKGAVGKRPRTVYTITSGGRRALTAWVGEPGEGPVLEFEQLLKVFFAENGSTDDVRRTLQGVRAWAHERTLVNIGVGHSYLEGRGPFPERAAVNMLVGRFLDDFLEAVDRWADWAEDVVSGWPDDPRDAEPVAAELEESLRRADDRAARWRKAVEEALEEAVEEAEPRTATRSTPAPRDT